MDSGKIETGKGDGKSSTKISAVSASTLKIDPSKKKTPKNNFTQSLSKIPKLEVGNSPDAKKPLIAVKKITKSLVSKNATKSLHLDLHKTASLLPSSRSNMNTQRSLNSKEQSPPVKLQKPQKESTSRVVAKKKLMAFENVKAKLKLCQTEYLSKWEAVKDELTPEEGKCELIAYVSNNNGQLIADNEQKFKIKCDVKGLDDFKTIVKNYAHNNCNSFLSLFDRLHNTSEKNGENFTEDDKTKLKNDNLKALDELLKKIESCEACDKPSETPRNSELEVKVKNLLKETDELRKELEESQNELSRIKKIEADKSSDKSSYKKDLEGRDNLLKAKQSECDELKKQFECLEKSISSDKTIQRELQEKLTNKTAEVDELKTRLKTITESNETQQSKNKEQEKRIKKLEADLNTAQKDAEKRIEHSIRDQVSKYTKKINIVEEMLKIAKDERDTLEIEVQRLTKESAKLNETAAELSKLRDKAQRTDEENQTLCQTVKDLKIKLQNIESQAGVDGVDHDEFENLKKANNVKNTTIEALEMELTKAKFNIRKLQEKIDMDRNLLKLRSSLIESLQSKETTQKLRLEDYFVEVGEKNNDIQMLKTELVTKTEEFKNLFSTLSTKQLELTRQEHMIKLLQESNERAQTLRVKQEAKIGRLEEELAHLRQTISNSTQYQNVILPNNDLAKSLFMIEASRYDDLNENLGYYLDERRRKRHINVNVKKYEK